jgi:hypothetical protein
MARWFRIFGAVLVAVVALVAAGCGGSSSPSSSAGTTATTTTPTTTNGAGTQSAAFKSFQTCLAKAGIKTNFGGGRPGGGGGGTPPTGGTPPAGGTRPGGGGGGGGFGGARNLTATQQKAFTACRAKLPAGSGRGGFGRRPNGGGGPTSPALAKYTACLEKNGVSLGGSNNTATFKKASAACAKYAPSGATAQ